MPVLRQVPRSEVTDETVTAYYNRLFGERDPVAEPGTATGTPGDWWTVFALSPDIFEHAVKGFAVYRNPARTIDPVLRRSEEHTSELQSLMRISYAVFCLNKKI